MKRKKLVSSHGKGHNLHISELQKQESQAVQRFTTGRVSGLNIPYRSTRYICIHRNYSVKIL